MAENTSVTYRLQSTKISDFRGTILFRFIWKQANGLQRSHIMAPWMSLRKRSLWSSSLQQPHVVLWDQNWISHALPQCPLFGCIPDPVAIVGARSTGVRKKKVVQFQETRKTLLIQQQELRVLEKQIQEEKLARGKKHLEMQSACLED